MEIDPVATLRCWPIDVTLAGQQYVIPALPASAWLLTILDGSGWMEIVPGLIGDAEQLRDDIVEGRIPYDECKSAAQAALCVAAGTRRWWSTVTLAKAATTSWVGGDMTLHGVDLERMSLAAFLSAAYRSATANMDRQQRARFDMDLDRPPAGTSPQEWYDDDAAEQGFLDAMGADAQQYADAQE